VKEKLINLEVNSLIVAMSSIQEELVEQEKKFPEKSPGLRGTAGWLLISRLEESGYYPRIVTENLSWGARKESIRINTAKWANSAKALGMEHILNGQLPMIREGLEYALMWKSSQFDTFAVSSLDKDGKINPTSDLSYVKYMESARRRWVPLTESDRAFLDSMNQIPESGSRDYMSKTIIGYLQFRESMAMIQTEIAKNPQTQSVLEKIAKQKSDVSTWASPAWTLSWKKPSAKESEANTRMTSKLFSEADWKTGREAGNFISRTITGSVHGVFGWMWDILRLWGWDPIATLVLGGWLMYGLYKTFKKFGFFGWMWALLGFWAVNNMESIFGRDASAKKLSSWGIAAPVDDTAKKTPKAPTQKTAPVAGVDSAPVTKDAEATSWLPDTSWKAQMLWLVPATATETVSEKWNTMSIFFGVKYTDLKNALWLKAGSPELQKSWEEIKKKIGYDNLSAEKKQQWDKLVADQDTMNMLDSYVKNIDVSEGIKKLKESDPAKYASLSLQQITELAKNLVVEKETPPESEAEKVKKEAENKELKEIYTLSQGHGDMWLALKLISSWYIPTILAPPEKGMLRVPYIAWGATYNPFNVLWHKTDASYSPAKWNTETRKYIDTLLGNTMKKEIEITAQLKPQTGGETLTKYNIELQKITALDALLKWGKWPGTPEFDKAYKEYMHSVETGKFRSIKNKFTSKEKNVANELERMTKAQVEVARVSSEIDAQAKTVTDAADKWKSDKSNTNKKAMLNAMDEYNKKITPLEQHGVNNAAILWEKEWKSILQKTPSSGWWASAFYEKNMAVIKKPIDWIKEAPGKVAGHWTGKTFMGVGMLSLMANAIAHEDGEWEKWFVDLVVEWRGWTGVGKAVRTYGVDFGLSMIPVVWVGHDYFMINSAQWRKIVTGADAELSEEEKYMRQTFMAVWILGAGWVLIKMTGKGMAKIPYLRKILPHGSMQVVWWVAHGTSRIAMQTMIWGWAGYAIYRLGSRMMPQS
jgi:hypothetical protein